MINEGIINITANGTEWIKDKASSTTTGTSREPSPFRTLWENGKLEIPLYSAIFLLSVLGNALVILTLARNSRMRTNTNVFLLNLAVSDLILAVLCMPFTLIGTLLRDFVFGEWMCRLVPFLQGKPKTLMNLRKSLWLFNSIEMHLERNFELG